MPFPIGMLQATEEVLEELQEKYPLESDEYADISQTRHYLDQRYGELLK